MLARSLLLGMCLLVATAAQAQAPANLLQNPGFETLKGDSPERWEFVTFRTGSQGRLVEGENGGSAVAITAADTTQRGCWAQNIAVTAGSALSFSGRYRTARNTVGAMLRVTFLKSASSAEFLSDERTTFPPTAAWADARALVPVPEGAVRARVELFNFFAPGEVMWDNVSIRYASDDERQAVARQLLDKEPSLSQIEYRPAEGAVLNVTPAAFVWVPIPGAKAYVVQYSRDKTFPAGQTTTVRDIRLSIYTPREKMAPGVWYWRYGVDAEQPVFSSARAFTIAKTATEFAYPDMDKAFARIPRAHPRLFTRAEQVAALRTSPEYQALRDATRGARALVGQPMHPEPPFLPKDPALRGKVYKEIFSAERPFVGGMENLAFAYLVTGDRTLGLEAKKRLMHLLSWNPEGSTSLFHNDEPAMDIMMRGPRTFDWIYDLMTPEERTQALQVFRVRAQQLYTNLKRRPFDSNPWESHAGRTLGFLGEASIAFAGDIPEAQEWLDYIVNIFYAVYPAWGSDDGGWAEGPSYWRAYMSMVLLFTRALDQATGIDLHRKPFFRNTGYFGLYCNPPYSRMSPFGDGEHGGVGRGGGSVLYMLSTVGKDPYLRWYARETGNDTPNGLTGLGWRDDSVTARPPADLPQARHFPRIGWVAMHSALHDGPANVHFMMKSSPYGAASHSHADQNAFILHAFGEPLAIVTGYYPWYGSPHHSQWTRETKAHNAITLDGQGQVQRSRVHNGRIAAFFTGPGYHYTVGDATNAYGGRATRALRHALFVRPEYVVVFDDVATPKPATAEWWLHSLEEMKLDGQEVGITRQDAALRVRFLEPAGLKMVQSGGFEPKPETNAVDHWHLMASSGEKTEAHRFLTVLYPYRRGQDAAVPAIANAKAENAVAANVGSDLVLFRRPGATGALRSGDLEAKADAAALARDGNGVTRLFAATASAASVRGQAQFESGVPVTLSMSTEGDGVTVAVQMSAAGRLRLRSAKKPAQVVCDGKEMAAGEWSWENGMVVLRLEAGDHTIALNARRRDPVAAAPRLTLEADGKTLSLDVVRGETQLLGTGVFPGVGGRYRLSVRGASRPARFAAGMAGAEWRPGAAAPELLLASGQPVMVTFDPREPARELSVRLELIAKPVNLTPERASTQNPPEGVLLEAEAFARQGGATVTLSKGQHAGTHGNDCVYNWGPEGHWLEWDVNVPKTGRYQIYAAAAGELPEALRAVSIDGRDAFPGSALQRFPGTGGWGRASADQWRLFLLRDDSGKPATVTLTAGKHTLRMTSVSGQHLNLDYLVLSPQ